MHLVMFLNLDGQITDRKTTLKQTYVSVLSTLFVTMFSTCLGIALGVAFTQHLWYLFRNYPMTVETIETLFCIRGTPILLLDWSGWTAAPVICSMATVILLLNIVRVFPPGALTVVSRTSAVTNDSIVPTFTADFVGNTSYNDAHAHAISLFGVQSSLWEYMYAIASTLLKSWKLTTSGACILCWVGLLMPLYPPAMFCLRSHPAERTAITTSASRDPIWIAKLSTKL